MRARTVTPPVTNLPVPGSISIRLLPSMVTAPADALILIAEAGGAL